MTNNKEVELEQEAWFSTYGLLTYQRILEAFKIKISSNNMYLLMQNTQALYAILIRAPVMQVFNSIIFQQAYDYQVYVQNLVIDYQLSDEAKKDETMAGASTRLELETERGNLQALNEEFSEQLFNHEKSIFRIQKSLKEISASIENAFQDIISLIFIENHHAEAIDYLRYKLFIEISIFNWQDAIARVISQINNKYGLTLDENTNLSSPLGMLTSITQKLQSLDFIGQAQEITQIAVNYRRKFSELILRITSLVALLPEHAFADKAKSYQEDLLFDSSIGE